MYDARQIANWFVRRAQQDGQSLSIMSLLKLTYIAHGWFLEIRKVPLFSNQVEAWQYGPVVRDVYQGFRGQGIDVDNELPGFPGDFPEHDRDLLEQVWTRYGKMSPFHLSEITHEQGGPWDIATKTGGNYAKIPNELIQKHYEMKRLKYLQSAHVD